MDSFNNIVSTQLIIFIDLLFFRFGTGLGDSWGNKAADDLLKVKGKGFRKEMAKKKRASFKGYLF
jgi:hypothetical protein